MELYSPLCGDCKLYDVNDYSIRIETFNRDTLISLYHDGKYCFGGEIMIFPKGKTTWEGFVPPHQFKDGDIIYNQFIQAVAIFCKQTDKATVSHCFLNCFKEFKIRHHHSKFLADWRLATEEEKQKLFDAIKANGYKWNAETKTLEKLIEPKFKVGDIVRSKNCPEAGSFVIVDVGEDTYSINLKKYCIKFEDQDNYELVPNKFNINTLKPFDKVLFRIHDKDTWCNGFYSFYKNNQHVVNSLTITKQCIPYKGNEYLLNTTDDCSNYYKTWEE